MSKSLPVIAAIPNYNMAPSLKKLLSDLSKQSYDHIYVLDDASTDDSEQVAAQFSNVTFVKGDHNGGGGAARNLLLPYLKQRVYVHFLDADVRIKTKNIVSLIRTLEFDDRTAFVGGLVEDVNGKQSIWNYGPPQSLWAMISAGLLMRLDELDRLRNYSGAIPRLLHSLLPGRPSPFKKPAPRTIHWAHEANLVIRSDVLKRLGGFDPHIREHDIQPLANKAQIAGLRGYFDPSFAVIQHDDINVRHYNRKTAQFMAEMYASRKYLGLIAWLIPPLYKRHL